MFLILKELRRFLTARTPPEADGFGIFIESISVFMTRVFTNGKKGAFHLLRNTGCFLLGPIVVLQAAFDP